MRSHSHFISSLPPLEEEQQQQQQQQRRAVAPQAAPLVFSLADADAVSSGGAADGQACWAEFEGATWHQVRAPMRQGASRVDGFGAEREERRGSQLLGVTVGLAPFLATMKAALQRASRRRAAVANAEAQTCIGAAHVLMVGRDSRIAALKQALAHQASVRIQMAWRRRSRLGHGAFVREVGGRSTCSSTARYSQGSLSCPAGRPCPRHAGTFYCFDQGPFFHGPIDIVEEGGSAVGLYLEHGPSLYSPAVGNGEATSACEITREPVPERPEVGNEARAQGKEAAQTEVEQAAGAGDPAGAAEDGRALASSGSKAFPQTLIQHNADGHASGQKEAVLYAPELNMQKRDQSQSAEPIVDQHVPMQQVAVLHAPKIIPQERVQEGPGEQTVDVLMQQKVGLYAVADAESRDAPGPAADLRPREEAAEADDRVAPESAAPLGPEEAWQNCNLEGPCAISPADGGAGTASPISACEGDQHEGDVIISACKSNRPAEDVVI